MQQSFHMINIAEAGIAAFLQLCLNFWQNLEKIAPLYSLRLQSQREWLIASTPFSF